MNTNYSPLGERIDHIVQQNPDKIFMRYMDKSYSFLEFNQVVNKLANALYKIGVKKGVKVALLLPNDDFFAIALTTILKMGAIAIPVNFHQRGNGLKYILDQSDSAYLIASGDYKVKIHEVLSELDKVHTVILDIPENEKVFFKTSKNVFSLNEITKNCSTSLSFEYPEMNPLDMMEIIYTSGTTGPPKGVVWTQNKFDKTPANSIGFNENDSMYTCLPLFHGLAQTMMFMCLLEGATWILSPKFSASRFWDDINRYQATWFNYIGAIIPILLNTPESIGESNQVATHCYGCGAPQEAKIWKEFERQFGVEIVEYYGSTEGGTVTIGTKPGSIGKVKDTYEVKIINEDGKECIPNEIGELLYKTKDKSYFFHGYYNNQDGTSEKIKNGWFRSGDLVYKDSEDYLYFVGRKTDSMRRRGENISPWEIESVVSKHEKIKECAAIPVPSILGEDEVKLCVVVEQGKSLTYQEIVTYCKDRMAYYLVPRYIEILSELPKTSTQKVERFKLAKRGLTETTWDRERVTTKPK